MTETIERSRTTTSTSLEKQPETLHEKEFKFGASTLKDIHDADLQQSPARAAETKVSKNIIQDLRHVVEECKNSTETARRYGLDDKVKLSAVDAAVAHAERTGKLPGHVDTSLASRMKTAIVRNKLDARREHVEDHHARHHGHHRQGFYGANHNLEDVRHEMLANLLNNRQLAGIQKGSKTLDEVKEEMGYGRDASADKSPNELLEERLQFLIAEEQALREAQQDRTEEAPSVDFAAVDVDTGFATELRNQAEFGFLQDSEGLELLLDGVVDIVPYIAERRAQETGRDASEIAAEVFQFEAMVRKRRKKGGLVTDEDCETLLLVQYLPILYDAVNFIMEKGLDPEAISKMESLKGELAALIQGAADPKSAIHDLFKQIKESLQDREMVEWTG